MAAPLHSATLPPAVIGRFRGETLLTMRAAYKICKEIGAAELAVAGAGVLMIAAAIAANQGWLDRHFLPSFFVTRNSYVLAENVVRVVIGVAGALVVFPLRRSFARAITHRRTLVLYALVGAGLGIAAAEVGLRAMHARASEWLLDGEEPRREPDATLGWRFVPGHAGRGNVSGREVEYAFDASGDRVRAPRDEVDPTRPTILFTGESLVLGYGLTWDETIPAQVAALTGIQTANIAVNGYATDQAYLRLREQLPRFRRPVAAVALFMTSLFGRNLDDDRPHLDPELNWSAPVAHPRLLWLCKFLVPYRSTATVEDGIATTRAVLRGMSALARQRGASLLLLVPQFGPEDALEHSLRTRVVDAAGVPSVFIEIDPGWRLPGDGHPDPRATRAMAAAVAARLARR